MASTNRERPWYREPESFVGLAALVVSISAVVVGIYEASLQRKHDRAEVWPHLEIATYTKPTGAAIYLDNTGVGPGIVRRIVVSVDGHAKRGWKDVISTLDSQASLEFGTSTVLNHAMRAGDRIALVDLPVESRPHDFWKAMSRVSVSLCYASVFDEYWTLTIQHVGDRLRWDQVGACPAQPDSVFF